MEGQLARYREIVSVEHVRAGQIEASARDQTGRIHHSAPLTWFDNVEPERHGSDGRGPDGRYLSHAERGNAGEPLSCASPADARLLGNKIEQPVAAAR